LNRFLATSSLFILLIGCSTAQTPSVNSASAPATSQPPAVTQTPAPTSLAFDRGYLDSSVSACTDFYQYSVGGWLAKNPIPPEYSSWGTMSRLSIANRETLRDIMQAAAAKPAAQRTPNEQRIGTFWTSCMAEDTIESSRLGPLQSELERIAAVHDSMTLQSEMARLQSMNLDVPFRLHSIQDLKNSTEVIADIYQGGLTLPDRDYYTKGDPASLKIREQFREYVTRMLTLVGDEPARAASEAATIARMETDLAKASMTNVQQRDPQAIYHRMTAAELEAMAPHVAWSQYVDAAGLPPIHSLNVAQPLFLKEVDRQITTAPLDDWKTYLRWHLIDHSASALTKDLSSERFRFYGTVLQGQKQQLPRWQRCVVFADNSMGEALGQAYVEKKFSAEAKQHVTAMVENMIAALGTDLSTLSWMSEPTRQQALIKLRAFQKKIAYPDTWRDYSKLTVTSGPFASNVLAADAFEFRRDMAKVGQPLDRSEWQMTPPTINAYYDGSMNEIVFPAGILQFPMFDLAQDDAFNYGAIGSVIGHEMTHGFDDEGSQFELERESGKLVDGCRPQELPGARGMRRTAIRRLRDRARRSSHRQARCRREHRRPRRRGHRLGRMATLAGRKAAPSGDRRLHSGATVLSRTGAVSCP
jgi:putative endopeptidase